MSDSVEITFGNGKIEYIYSAGGAKVQKKVTKGTVVTTTDYLGGFTASVRFARVNAPNKAVLEFFTSSVRFACVQHQKGITMLEIADISH